MERSYIEAEHNGIHLTEQSAESDLDLQPGESIYVEDEDD